MRVTNIHTERYRMVLLQEVQTSTEKAKRHSQTGNAASWRLTVLSMLQVGG